MNPEELNLLLSKKSFFSLKIINKKVRSIITTDKSDKNGPVINIKG